MKTTLVFLVALGMLFSPAFAGGDSDYSGFRISKTTPSGDPILIWNCDWDWDKGYQMHITMHAESPVDEDKNVEIYVYNPNKNEWFHQYTCTNVDDWGKDCKFYIPVYWGLSKNDENAYVNLVKAEITDGEDVYSKTFNFHISHKQSSREETILSKISEFETVLAGCPAHASEFSGVIAEATNLGRECKLEDSRNVVTGAINKLKAYQAAGECEVITIQPDKPKESIPTEYVKPGSEVEEEPASTQPTGTIAPPPAATTTNGGGSPCPVGFVLLGLLGVAAFAWRKA